MHCVAVWPDPELETVAVGEGQMRICRSCSNTSPMQVQAKLRIYSAPVYM